MPDQRELAGRVLAGRYRLESQLGEGGMSAIWRAEHVVLGAPVAVKLIDPGIAQDPDMLARFLQEAKAAASLRSPHVVQVLDYGVEDGLPFIVMELLEGETLRRRLKRKHRLDPLQTTRIMSQVARAISRAHEANIIHRDLKPENVFLVTNEDDELAKVLDFGVAKWDAVDENTIATKTRTGTLLGTPHYMSPEQVKGDRVVDCRSDLWSLAVIAFECLTGKRPFDSIGLGELVLQICSHPLPVPSSVGPVPPAFDRWFVRAAARDPSQRFQSARELAESLREALGAAQSATYADEPGELDPDRTEALPTVMEARTPTGTSSARNAEAAPFAVTLAAAAKDLDPGNELAAHGEVAFDANLPADASESGTSREFWVWFGGLGALVLALAAVLVWLKAPGEPESIPGDGGVVAPAEPAPSLSRQKRATTRIPTRRTRERMLTGAASPSSSSSSAPWSAPSGLPSSAAVSGPSPGPAPDDAGVVPTADARD